MSRSAIAYAGGAAVAKTEVRRTSGDAIALPLSRVAAYEGSSFYFIGFSFAGFKAFNFYCFQANLFLFHTNRSLVFAK